MIKEPTFTEQSTQSDFIHGLNFYASNMNYSDSKGFAITWAEKNNIDTSILKKVDEWKFKNIGFVCQMIKNGLVYDTSKLTNMLNDLSISYVSNEQKLVEKKEIVKNDFIPVTERRINEDLAFIDSWLDDFFLEPTKKIKADFKGTRKDIDECLEFINKLYTEVKTDGTYGKEAYYDEKTKSAFLKLILFIRGEVEKRQKVLMSNKTKTVVSKNPIKQAKKVQYQATDKDLHISSITPSSIVGKKKLYAFDTKSRKLLCFVANSDKGFFFTGTTLHNYDNEKSYQKILRKPETVFFKEADISISYLNKTIQGIRAKELPISSGRLNKNMILLKAS